LAWYGARYGALDPLLWDLDALMHLDHAQADSVRISRGS
jgi:hypothetical protein